jgi:hypothetical protein
MSTLFKIKSVYKHEFLANITFFSKINIDIHDLIDRNAFYL